MSLQSAEGALRQRSTHAG